MRDPVERIIGFIKRQEQLAQAAEARNVWSRRLPSLAPTVSAIIDAFQAGFAGGADASVHLDAKRQDFPLLIVVAPEEESDTRSLTNASCQFRVEDDGIVYGVRYPFHDVCRDVRPERFVDLGEPENVTAEQLGHAVADFLEWAAVGEGCGVRRLKFRSTEASEAPAPFQMRVVAA